MPSSLERFHRRALEGQSGVGHALLRGFTAALAPGYAAAVATRNAMFDRGFRVAHRAARPVVCVGNITTGGTGKTPIVAWLAKKMREAHLHPAILTRGYKSTGNQKSDEQLLLQRELGGDVIVHADPNRVAGAMAVLKTSPETNLFIMDDGFQHRRLHRDFDLVLIDASNPFGFGHLLPRGLLRESPSVLRRASAMLVTHGETSTIEKIDSLRMQLQKFSAAPIFLCRHVLENLDDLKGKRVFTFSGIGNPQAFETAIDRAGLSRIGTMRFADHHNYTRADLQALAEQTRGADVLLTTQKDWVKVERLISEVPQLPQARVVKMKIEFDADDEAALLQMIFASIKSAN